MVLLDTFEYQVKSNKLRKKYSASRKFNKPAIAVPLCCRAFLLPCLSVDVLLCCRDVKHVRCPNHRPSLGVGQLALFNKRDSDGFWRYRTAYEAR